MQEAKILLSTCNDAKEFVGIVSKYDFEVDLVSGRYAIDAKSLMGVFSLVAMNQDLSKPIQMQMYAEPAACALLLKEAEPYLAK